MADDGNPYTDLVIPHDDEPPFDPWDDMAPTGPAPEPGPARERPAGIRGRLYSVSDLAALPEPRPLIQRTLDLGTVALLAGYWGTLKSFTALDWGASIATGRPWMGRRTEPKKVLYIAGEGAYGIAQRLESWQKGWRREIPDDMFTLLPAPVPLLNSTAVLELCGLVAEDGYGVVFVDTISKSIAGADENSAKDMSKAVESLYLIQSHTRGGTVIGIHHTGKDKTTVRGSSALEAGVDTVYITEGSPDRLTLSRTKRKDGPTEDVHNMRFSAVAGTRSGVVEALADSHGPSEKEVSALDIFSAQFSETGATRNEFVGALVEGGMSQSTAYKVANALVKGGSLVDRGTPSRPRFWLSEDVAA